MSATIFRFGEWQVDPASNSVSSGSLRRQLEPRAMEVLLCLCQRPGEVLTPEALLQACWGTSELGDNPIHKVITQLRRALGDSSAAPNYIETIRKRGYRTLAEVFVEEDVPSGSWTAGSPFRGLEAFEQAHAPVFFGRKLACDQLYEVVQRQLAQACALALVLGPSGSGKTSLVRAGLLPRLGLGPQDQLVFDCADIGESSLFEALASVLLDAEPGGAPLFEGHSAAGLARRLQEDLELVMAQLQTRLPQLGLALFIDRFEAIFRFSHIEEAERRAFVGVLDQLARAGGLLIILGCRNDFYPQLSDYAALRTLRQQGGHFDLYPPSRAELAQIIRQPVRAAQLSVDEGLDDALLEAAGKGADALPLLQYCLNELYRQRSPDGRLLASAYQAMGGIEGAIGQRAEQVVAALTPVQAAALPAVLSRLVNVVDNATAVTARHASWSGLGTPAERELVQALVDARLFVSDLEGGEAAFGVAHEALLRRWPRAADWIAQHRAALQTRSRIAAAAERWHSGARARDLLLPRGTQVNQARELAANKDLPLQALEQDFILASVQRARVFERLRMTALALLAGLCILAAGLGIAARNAQLSAEGHRAEADELMGFMLNDFADKLRPLGRLELLDQIGARALPYLAKPPAQQLEAELAQRVKGLQLIAEVAIKRTEYVRADQALMAAETLLNDTAPSKALLKAAGATAFWRGQIALFQKDLVRAELHMLNYLRLSDTLAALAPDDIDTWIEQSYAHTNVGTVALQRGRMDQAAREFEQSISLKTRALGQRTGSKGLQVDLANSISWLARAEQYRGKLDRAMQLLEQQLTLLSELHQAVPGNGDWTHRIATNWQQRGELHMARNQTSAALAAFGESRVLLHALMLQDPSNQVWQFVALQLSLRTADATGKTTAKQWQSLHAQVTMRAGAQHKSAQVQQLLAYSWRVLGRLQAQERQLKDAGQAFAAGLAILKDLHAKVPQDRSVRRDYADALLLPAEWLPPDAAALVQCKLAKDLMAPVDAAVRDIDILDPWVRAKFCLGEHAQVSEQLNVLEKIAYRRASFTRSLSIYQRQKGKPNA